MATLNPWLQLWDETLFPRLRDEHKSLDFPSVRHRAFYEALIIEAGKCFRMSCNDGFYGTVWDPIWSGGFSRLHFVRDCKNLFRRAFQMRKRLLPFDIYALPRNTLALCWLFQHSTRPRGGACCLLWGSSLVTSSLLRRGLSSSYGRDPQNPCYCKDRCGDPCYNKDRCKVLAAARTEMRSLVRQGLLWKPCYCKDFDPCYSKKLLVFATAKLTTRSLLRKTGALILATVRIAGESLLLKTGDLILATGRIAEESLLRKTGDLILATGRIAEESLLL
ncbi:hypothetical protein ACLKA6_005756 [Drosophila palustris]